MSSRFARPPERFPDNCPECGGKGGHRGSCSHSGLVGPIADRRQRAREAAQDSAQVVQSWAIGAIETGIEVATQVKITEDIVEAFMLADTRKYPDDPMPDEEMIKAAFRAAGFEVVE